MLDDINELAITYIPLSLFTIEWSIMVGETSSINYILELIDVDHELRKPKEAHITLKNPRWIDRLPVILDKLGIGLIRHIIEFSYCPKMYKVKYKYYTFSKGKLIKLKPMNTDIYPYRYHIDIQSEKWKQTYPKIE